MTELTSLPTARSAFAEGSVVRLKSDASFNFVVIPAPENIAQPFPKKTPLTWVAFRCGDVGINVFAMPTVALEEVPLDDLAKLRTRALGGPGLGEILKEFGVDPLALVKLISKSEPEPGLDA